jgi:hypothetical protein
MSKLGFAIFAFAVGSSGAVAAQLLTPDQLAACQPDFDKYCGGRAPGSEPVVGCIVTGPWSDACKKVMDEFDEKRREGKAGAKN